jgi:hypothetical protein
MAKRIEQKGGLEWFLEKTTQEPIRPDEFTVRQAFERAGAGSTVAQMRCKLARMEHSKEITSRKVLMDGKWINVYRKAH